MTAAARHWLTLVLWSIFAGIALSWVGRLFSPSLQHAFTKFNATITLTFVILGLIFSFIYRLRFGFGFVGFPPKIGWRLHTFPPPLWLAAPISLAVMEFWALIFSRPLPWPALAGTYLLVGWLIGVAMQRLLRYANGTQMQRDAVRGAAPATDHPLSSIVDWIRSPEEPILSPEQDKFGVNNSAIRVAQRLRMLDDHRVPTLSLLDAPGAGKTSFLNLVNHHLAIGEAGPLISLREVSVWAAQTPEAMLELIINLMCEELRNEVDTFWFRGMSHEFVRSLRAKESVAQSLFGWLISPPRANRMLDEISGVLVALNRRLVLVVEDLERKRAELPQFTESLSGVLDLIRSTEGISYVVTAESSAREDGLDPIIDFTRLCRIDDSLPRLSPSRCSEILEEYRKSIAAELQSRQIIDPMPKEVRQRRWLDTCKTLCNLPLTPRCLKKSLINADNRIRGLAGEVDVDGVIIAAIYREADPGRWNIYLRSHAQYRDSDLLQTQAVAAPAGHSILIPDIPLMSLPPVGSDFANSPDACPQNIFAGGRANYWTRFTTGQCDGILDQTVLKAIQDGDVDGALGLNDQNNGGGYRERVCHFSHFAARHDFLTRLLERLAQPEMGPYLRAVQFPTIPTVLAWLQIATLRSPTPPGYDSISGYQRTKAFEVNLEVAMALIRPFDYLNAEFFGVPFTPASSDLWGVTWGGVSSTREMFLMMLADQVQSWEKKGESSIVRLLNNASPAALTVFSRLFSVSYEPYNGKVDKKEAISKRCVAWLKNAKNPVDLPHVGKLLGAAISSGCDSIPELLYPQILYGWCDLSDTARASNTPDVSDLINGQHGLFATPMDSDACIPGLPMRQIIQLLVKVDPAAGLRDWNCEHLIQKAKNLRAAAGIKHGPSSVPAPLDGAN